MKTEEKDLIFEASLDPVVQKRFPSMVIGNPEHEQDDELWRCFRCGGSIRTNGDIKKGKMCSKCRSTHVGAAIPRWWETVVLFFRTGRIYLAQKEVRIEPNEEE